jgi:hypothetical protein
MGRLGRIYLERNFDREQITDRLVRVLKSLVVARRAPDGHR